MNPQHKTSAEAPRPVSAVFVALLGLALAQPLIAQSTSAPAPAAPSGASESEVVELPAYTVTGSNIPRIDEELNLPTSVVDAETIELTGASSPGEYLEFLPMAGEPSVNEQSTTGAAARGDVNSPELRGIGSGSTLVLFNGRRIAPHPISQSDGGIPSLAANVNTMPIGSSTRMEILRDGASAIYGADAAAGVINFRSTGRFEGANLRLRATATEDGGAGERSLRFEQGQFLANGRTHLNFSAEFYHRDMLRASDRAFSASSDNRLLAPAPWDGFTPRPSGATAADNDFDGRSADSNYGAWVVGTFQTVPETGETIFVGSRPTGNRGINTSGTTNTLTVATTGIFYLVPLAGGSTGSQSGTPSRNRDNQVTGYYFDPSPQRALLPEINRTQMVVQFDHPINRKLDFFGDFLFYASESENIRDATDIDSTTEPLIFVPAANPWNPFGVRFYHPTGVANTDGTPRLVGTPRDVLFGSGAGRRPREFPIREITVRNLALRGLLGLRGALGDNHRWESAAMYSRARTQDDETFNVRESRLREALARTDSTAFNPFGYRFAIDPADSRIKVGAEYTNPATVVDPLFDTFSRTGTTSITTWDLKVSGDLMKIWGGPIGIASGVEYRHETYSDFRPPFAGMNPPGSSLTNPFLRENDDDFIDLSPNLNLNSSRDIASGFVEVLLPIFGRDNERPLLHRLELGLAVRYENFSDFGDATKPKVSLAWAPGSKLKFRASYNESFRAPNLVQTNTSPLQRAVTGISDDYRGPVTPLAIDQATTRTVIRRGNEELDPELAETVTAGVVVEVPWIKGLSFTADYWRLKQRDVISLVTAADLIDLDTDALAAATQAQLASGTPIGQVVVQSGTEYLGDPRVTRLPVTQADRDYFATYNATVPAAEQRAPVGAIQFLLEDYVNLTRRDLEGVDLGFVYELRETRAGRFTISGEATWMRHHSEVPFEGALEDNLLRENGRPKWRGDVGVVWRPNRVWQAGWHVTYFGPFVDTGATTTQADYEALGRPDHISPQINPSGGISYYFEVKDWLNHNVFVQYSSPEDDGWLAGTTVRLGVNNVRNEQPPVADEPFGYRRASPLIRGRQYALSLTKRF